MIPRALAIAIGWAIVAAIIVLSVMPSPPTIDVEQGDKIGHFIGYGALMFWFSQLYSARRTRLAYAVTFIAMGIALEFVQGALRYRTFEVLDMAANATGVLLGLGAALLLPRIRVGVH